ncbi:cytochrome o ubiquinol oxidase subunit IV [Camelimonas abortus]|uniref:Cytochrome bo(3) ubiquinol oxidase subunit 4 n=1 Tax=Camelimonas abortus TaxID=1017184 RepID=A0ABV7LEY6_9HYPH
MNDAGHDSHGAALHDVAPHDAAALPHGTLKGYLTGFVLSAILTAIPFWLVMAGPFFSSQTTAVIVLALAGVQVVVHMTFFLHMNGRVEGGWSMMALVFTIIVVVIVLAGSLWVMTHLNANLMAPEQMMRR